MAGEVREEIRERNGREEGGEERRGDGKRAERENKP